MFSKLVRTQRENLYEFLKKRGFILWVTIVSLSTGCISQQPFERPRTWPGPKADGSVCLGFAGKYQNAAIDAARSRYAANEGVSLASKLALYAWPLGAPSQPTFESTPVTVALSISVQDGISIQVVQSDNQTISFRNGPGTKLTCGSGVFTIERKTKHISGGSTDYIGYRMQLYQLSNGDIVVSTYRAGDRMGPTGSYGPVPSEEAWFRFAKVQ